MGTLNRRNLSGVYIFHKFEDDKTPQPTCFEDCSEETQDKWLDTLHPDALKRLAKHLAKTLREIGEHIDILNV
jgi:hypothetical protein